MAASEPDSIHGANLIDRLVGYGVRYFGGNRPTAPVPARELLLELARSPESRVRTAIVALLLRRPELAKVAEQVAQELTTDDPAQRLLLLSSVVGAALQREWSFTLNLYLPGSEMIDAEHLARDLGLPSPEEDFGRPCLVAASRLLDRDEIFPLNYRADWESAARRLMAQLVTEARAGGA